jgi:hypothetical protein
MADVQVVLEPFEEISLSVDRLREIALRHSRVSELLGDLDDDQIVLGLPDVLGREKNGDSPFRATLFDRRTNRAVELAGRLRAPEQLDVRPIAYAPVPHADELRIAADVLRHDERFEHLRDRDDVTIYQPMPPLADAERPDGTFARRPTLGIYDPKGGPRHRIVAVDLAERAIDWEPRGVDPASDSDCESWLPVGVDSISSSGGLAQVRVRVLSGSTELWDLIVVRPRDSSPQTFGKGSGVELRMVRYRGKLIFWRAHVPILNVLYDDGISYRDWQSQETLFIANGSDPVGAGWRVCNQAPATILEAGTDAGNFQGVAFWYSNGELRIVSELQAGWYRYISDWRLTDWGTIKPRFGFTGTRNPRTCKRHTHHAYWRFDFDIEGAANDVVEQLGLFFPTKPRWFSITQETKRKRSLFARAWRVRDKATGRGYRIYPGLVDGTADAYGVSDLWFLRYRGSELDDGVSIVSGSAAQTQIQIDKYLNGESIDGSDVVVWYAGHFLHDEISPGPNVGHIVGPELRPFNW